MYSHANVMALVAVGAVAVLLIIGLLLRLILKKPEKHPDLAPRDNSVSDSLAARLAEHGHKAAKPEAAAPSTPEAAKDA
jgi:hypothetical protein